MSSQPNREPLWYRHAWWLPGIATLIALALAAAALRPREHDVLLVAAILCALPWSLAMLLLDLSGGFADRAALVVCIGLGINLAALWCATALLRARHRARLSGGPAGRRAPAMDH
ncbi:MAG: hypothetical protein J7549_00860 [Variovorax sp.]|nr:hypothetical protein [Variovorax sp.]